jgi:hypothetical protein
MQTKYTAEDLARKILHSADLGPVITAAQAAHILAHFPGVADLVEAAYRLGCEDADAEDEIYQDGYEAGKIEGERAALTDECDAEERGYERGYAHGMNVGKAESEGRGLLDKIRALVSAENDRVAADEYRRGRAEADSEHYAVGYARGYEDGKDDATPSVLVEEVSK